MVREDVMDVYNVYILVPYEYLREHRYSVSKTTAEKHVTDLVQLLIDEHKESIEIEKVMLSELVAADMEFTSMYEDRIKELASEISRLETVTFENCMENTSPEHSMMDYIQWEMIEVLT